MIPEYYEEPETVVSLEIKEYEREDIKAQLPRFETEYNFTNPLEYQYFE